MQYRYSKAMLVIIMKLHNCIVYRYYLKLETLKIIFKHIVYLYFKISVKKMPHLIKNDTFYNCKAKFSAMILCLVVFMAMLDVFLPQTFCSLCSLPY